jgi:LacI family transcriptional regulator
MRKKRITLKDIADRCGIHKSTVSLILNGRDAEYPLRAETVAKVKQVAAELGYTPDRLARGLITGRSRLMGYSFPYSLHYRTTLDYGFSLERTVALVNPHYLGGMIACAVDRDYEVVCLPRYDEPGMTAPRSKVCPDIVDGVVWIHPSAMNRQYADIHESGMPLMLVGRSPAHPDLPTCDIDNVSDARRLTRHMIENGAHRFGFFCEVYPEYEVGASRYDGFMEALGEAGLELDPANVFTGPEGADVDAVTQRLQQDPSSMDGLFISSGPVSGLVEKLEELGVDLMRDLHAGTFADSIERAYARPELSVIQMNHYTMGFEAAKMLLDGLDGDMSRGEHRFVDTHLKARGE